MFQFGLLTAILDGWTYEEAVDIAAGLGFQCLEVACWPAGKAGGGMPACPTSTRSGCWRTTPTPNM